MPNAIDSAAAPAPARVFGLAEFIAWIERRPGSAFAWFLALHFAIWTALPSLLYANLPLDLIEALTYGREWPLGSDKLPPLPWWLVEIMYRLFGVDIAYYALAEIVVIIAFIAVWALARRLVGSLGALVSILIIDGMHYFQYTAVKFNHDVMQLPFWALAGYSFHAALKRGRLRHWLLLGVAFGGALWAKYFVVMLAAPYALFLFLDRDARRTLRTPGPWLGIALALLITSPHLAWLIKNHFVPFAYVDERSSEAQGWFDHILHPAFFALGQMFFMLPTLIMAATLAWPRSADAAAALARSGTARGWRRCLHYPARMLANLRAAGAAALSPAPRTARPADGSVDAYDRRIVTLITFGPAAAMLATMIVSGRGAITMWGYPLWLFFGLWTVMFSPNAIDFVRLARIVIIWAVVLATLMFAFLADYTFMPLLDHRYRAAFFPGGQLAAILTERFHAATGGRKLRYVIGTMWLGGNVAHYSPDQPHVLIDGLPRRAPWVDLAAMRAEGAVAVWIKGDLTHLPPAIAAVAPSARVGTPFVLPPRRFGTTATRFGWALLMPEPQSGATPRP